MNKLIEMEITNLNEFFIILQRGEVTRGTSTYVTMIAEFLAYIAHFRIKDGEKQRKC